MKKLIALVLAVGMLLVCLPALADAPTLSLRFAASPKDVAISDTVRAINASYRGTIYDMFIFWEEGGSLRYDITRQKRLVNESWSFSPAAYGMTSGEGTRAWACYLASDAGDAAADFYTTYVNAETPYVRLALNPWQVGADGSLTEVAVEANQRLLVKYRDEIKQIVDQYRHPDAYPATWYPHNTICAAGIAFRDVRPELTSKWYNFVALDLSEDGVQRFDLVASNLFIIGKVTVTKHDDDVVVEWQLNRQGTNDANFELEDEFLTIFPDLDAVTELEPADFTGTVYEFGKPISISEDLGGDTNVLLYIRNQATYCDNLSYKHQKPIYHERYWPNLDWRMEAREEMMKLVNADLEN